MELGTLLTTQRIARPAANPVEAAATAAPAMDFADLLQANDAPLPEQDNHAIEHDKEPTAETAVDEKQSDEDNTDAVNLSATMPQSPLPQPPAPLVAFSTTPPVTAEVLPDNTPQTPLVATVLPLIAAATGPILAKPIGEGTNTDTAITSNATEGGDVIDALLAKFTNPNFDSVAQNASLPALPAMAPESPAVAEATPHPTAPKSLAVAGEPLNPNAEAKPKALSAESLLQNDQPRQQRLTLGDSKATAQGPSDTPIVTDATANSNLTPTLPAPTPQANNNAAIAAKPLLVPAHAMTPVTEQVAVQIVKSAKLGTDKIRIQLSPEDLGRVEIKLEMSKDSVVKAVVSADKPETAEWLARDAKQLERALADAGFKLDQSNLEFKQSNTGQNHHQAQQFGQDYRDEQSSANKYYGDKHGLAELMPEHAATIHQYTVTTDGVNMMV